VLDAVIGSTSRNPRLTDEKLPESGGRRDLLAVISGEKGAVWLNVHYRLSTRGGLRDLVSPGGIAAKLGQLELFGVDAAARQPVCA
jgi:hypothetical protein